MRRPVCAGCKVDMTKEESGVELIVMSASQGDEKHAEGPYQLWSADEFVCRSCGNVVLVGFGSHPYAYAGSADFEFRLAQAKANGARIVYEYLINVPQEEDDGELG